MPRKKSEEINGSKNIFKKLLVISGNFLTSVQEIFGCRRVVAQFCVRRKRKDSEGIVIEDSHESFINDIETRRIVLVLRRSLNQ